MGWSQLHEELGITSPWYVKKWRHREAGPYCKVQSRREILRNSVLWTCPWRVWVSVLHCCCRLSPSAPLACEICPFCLALGSEDEGVWGWGGGWREGHCPAGGDLVAPILAGDSFEYLCCWGINNKHLQLSSTPTPFCLIPVFKPHFLHWLCMCECGVHTHQSEHVWRSEDSARESLLFYHVGPWIELGPSGSVLSIFMRSNPGFLGICLFSLVENHLENVCCLSFGWSQCLALSNHMENSREWVEFTSHCWMPLSLGGSWFPLLNSLVWVSRCWPSGSCVLLSRKDSWNPVDSSIQVLSSLSELKWGLAWNHFQRGTEVACMLMPDAWVTLCMKQFPVYCLLCSHGDLLQ